MRSLRCWRGGLGWIMGASGRRGERRGRSVWKCVGRCGRGGGMSCSYGKGGNASALLVLVCGEYDGRACKGSWNQWRGTPENTVGSLFFLRRRSETCLGKEGAGSNARCERSLLCWGRRSRSASHQVIPKSRARLVLAPYRGGSCGYCLLWRMTSSKL